MNIGFTGTRDGMTVTQRMHVRKILSAMFHVGDVFHHGDCVGSDEQAHAIALDIGYRIVVHPPKKSTLRAYCKSDTILDEQEYLTRNKAIVDASYIVIAAPNSDHDHSRSGTWQTIRYCRNRCKFVIIVTPDDVVDQECLYTAYQPIL